MERSHFLITINILVTGHQLKGMWVELDGTYWSWTLRLFRFKTSKTVGTSSSHKPSTRHQQQRSAFLYIFYIKELVLDSFYTTSDMYVSRVYRSLEKHGDLSANILTISLTITFVIVLWNCNDLLEISCRRNSCYRQVSHEAGFRPPKISILASRLLFYNTPPSSTHRSRRGYNWQQRISSHWTILLGKYGPAQF